ncbi:MAG: ATP-binding protein [Desulfocapsaceae bacterium]
MTIKKLKYKFILVIGVVLLVSFGVLLSYMTTLQNDLVIGQAQQQARMIHHQLILTRQWISDHQGLFVVKTDEVRENPYLEIPQIETQNGVTLVKRNPAMVTRELSEYAQKAGHGWFRVTSLDPVNPLNEPDAFERSSLERFNKIPLDEYMEIESSDSHKMLRYISPLIVKSSCLSCHAKHGYKEGDIRGALSISIPIDWADSIIKRNNIFIFMLGSFAVLAVTGLLYLLFNALVSNRLAALEQIMDHYPEGPDPDISPPEGEDEIGRLSSRFAALCVRLDQSRSKLQQAHEQAFYNEKMAALGQITAGIAHEVNNPLGGLLNCVSNIQDDPENKELQTRYLPLIDKGLHQIESIMRQLLNFGRNMPLQLTKVDIDEEIKECMVLLNYRMKNIDLNLQLGITETLCVDTEAIKQIVVNIGLNAIQAMPDGGKFTIISSYESDKITIIFSDTGIGIDKEIIDKIFDPFFTTKEVGQGTGLGLAVTYSLLQQMGGTIKVDSRMSGGTTFTVQIPVVHHCQSEAGID